jgi:lysophospholipase L1-like esterase
MATLLDYLGTTKLRDAWPKIKANIIAINNQLIAHIAGSADKHAAEHVTYSGEATGDNVKDAIDDVKTDLTNLSFTGSDHDALVTAALIDTDGTNYGAEGEATYLDGRLTAWEDKHNDLSSGVALKADITYVDAQVASVSDGTPESFADLAAIEAAYPTGDDYVKLNLDDGYVYKWSGAAWVQGWVYQAAAIADESVTTAKLAKDAGIQYPWLSDGTFDLDDVWLTGIYMVNTAVQNNPLSTSGVLHVIRSKSTVENEYVWVAQTITSISNLSNKTYRRILYINENTSEISYIRDWIDQSITDGSITTDRIADEAVTADKLTDEINETLSQVNDNTAKTSGLAIVNDDWAQLERNYSWTEGKFIYWDGDEFIEGNSASFHYSEPIPVSEGEIWRIVTFSETTGNWNVIIRGYLLNGETWVQNIAPDVNAVNYSISTITIPAGVTHMVVVGKSYTNYRATRVLKLVEFTNVWDYVTMTKTDGKYIDNSGVEQTDAGLSYTEAIPVVAGEIYRIANVHSGTGDTFTTRGVFLDAEDALVAAIPANPNALSIYAYNDVIVPAGATQMIVNFNNEILTRDDVYKSLTISLASEAAAIYADNSKIRYKLWAAYGDSTTYLEEWCKAVENATSVRLRTFGYSSASVTTRYADNTLTDTTRMDAIIAKAPDIITILGGLNDTGQTVGDGSDMAVDMGEEDLSEFYGAYSYIIKYFLTALPEVRLILMTTTCSANNPANVEFAQAVKVLGEYFGLEVIDARAAMGMNVLTKYIYTADNVHLSYRGAQRVADTVIDKLL